MPRPIKCRMVGFVPDVLFFKPAGISMRDLEDVELSLDDLESIRLADLEGLYQEDAAGRMGVSRQTFANILASARSKMAECLILGKALRVEGGTITTQPDGKNHAHICTRRKRCCRKNIQEELS